MAGWLSTLKRELTGETSEAAHAPRRAWSPQAPATYSCRVRTINMQIIGLFEVRGLSRNEVPELLPDNCRTALGIGSWTAKSALLLICPRFCPA